MKFLNIEENKKQKEVNSDPLFSHHLESTRNNLLYLFYHIFICWSILPQPTLFFGVFQRITFNLNAVLKRKIASKYISFYKREFSVCTLQPWAYWLRTQTEISKSCHKACLCCLFRDCDFGQVPLSLITLIWHIGRKSPRGCHYEN